MAVWVDKWIMWFAPEAFKLPSGLLTFPHYDSAMFLTYISTVPSMALFLFHSETHFFERYQRYYSDIEGKATYNKIRTNHRAIMQSVFGCAGQFVLLQGSIALICMVMAPAIISFLKGDFIQIGIMRYGLLGAAFHVMIMFSLVLLSYFDSRKAALFVQTTFLVTNAAITLAAMKGGFPYYGYGYFLSSVITFIVAAIIMTQHLLRLPYHTFITTNSSVATA